MYHVYKNEDLHKIIYHHFENYPLQTTKMISFILWEKVLKMMIIKEHLSLDGFKTILIIKSAFKNRLSLPLKQAFPDIEPEAIPELVNHTEVLDPNWLSGFTAGDGCFSVYYRKDSRSKLGYSPKPQFRISQDNRDKLILERISIVLGCGKVYQHKTGMCDLSVGSLGELNDKIIPFFSRYKLENMKNIDYLYFCRIISIMKKGRHLTPEGLDQIKRIIERDKDSGNK